MRRPEACPRCARPSDTWTFERDQGLAGCPCGEVIAIDFDDRPTPGDILSKAPRKPRMWEEDARPDGFTATLKPSMRGFWFTLPIMLLGVVPGLLYGVRVPLFVEGPDEARFVAERANALLATDGRTIAGDYRGQHVRIADTEPHTRIEDEITVKAEQVEDALEPREDAERTPPLRRLR